MSGSKLGQNGERDLGLMYEFAICYAAMNGVEFLVHFLTQKFKNDTFEPYRCLISVTDSLGLLYHVQLVILGVNELVAFGKHPSQGNVLLIMVPVRSFIWATRRLISTYSLPSSLFLVRLML